MDRKVERVGSKRNVRDFTSAPKYYAPLPIYVFSKVSLATCLCHLSQWRTTPAQRYVQGESVVQQATDIIPQF